MITKVVYNDNSWFIGKRASKETGFWENHETLGTHHFTVIKGDSHFSLLKGLEIAVPIVNIRYFILDYKEAED
jgi:hypothetical protein